MSAKDAQMMRRLIDSIKNADRGKTSGYDTTATVRRIEDGTAWVHIPGGVDETPVKLTIAAAPGDQVQVRVSGGRAFLVGNATAPPTDDTTARAAVRQIGAVSKVVKTVQRIAEQAARIAGNTNQYFWHTESGTDTGAHITEIPQEAFLRDPESGGGNLLARSNGIAVRDGLTELAQFSADGITTCNGGAPYFNVLATGTPATSYRIKFPMSAPETRVISLPMPADRSTVTSIDVGFYAGTYGSIYRFTYGQPRTESFDGGAFTAAYDGDSTITIVYASSTERQITIDVAGDFPTPYFTFGTRYGDPGIFSAVIGEGLTASGQDQTVVGKYNEADTRDGYVFIVGNGVSDSSRSNALTVDWDGNLDCANHKCGITERGTDGYWTWYKYSDGSFDMYRRTSATITSYYDLSFLHGYYADYNFPAGCTPSNTNYGVFTSWKIGSGFGWDGGVGNKTTSGFRAYAMGSASESQACVIDLHVHGTYQ